MKKIILILLLFFSLNGFSQFIVNSYRFGAAVFSPSDIAGLRLWTQADNLVLSNDDPVSTWADLSGNSNDFTSTTTLRPLYKTNIQNGKPVVRFDGVNDFMEKATPTGLDGGTGMTIFIIMKNPAITLNCLLAKWDYQTQGSWMWTTFSTDETRMYTATVLNDGGSAYNTTTNADMTNTFYLLEMVYDGSQGTAANRVKIYKNTTLSTVSATGTLVTSLLSATSTLKVGRAGGSLGWYFTGDIGEVLIYDSALSDVNRGLVETYINGRWAIY